MRAVSLWQPYASLIFAMIEDRAVKPTETRCWELPVWMINERGIVHAAKTKRGMGRGMPEELHELCMDVFGCGYIYSLPYGAALGTAVFGKARPMPEAQPASDEDRIAGDWTAGRWAWPLTQPRAFKEPVPMRGFQRFWTPTEDVRAAIHSQSPAPGETHFHTCEACFHVWSHENREGASHLCPKCNAGPFTEGWGSFRAAHEERVRLKSIPSQTASQGEKKP